MYEKSVAKKTLSDGSKGHRIQFEFSSEAYERLQRIKDKSGVSTYAELVRNSMRLYEWVIDQQQGGYKIGLIKDDRLVKEVEFIY